MKNLTLLLTFLAVTAIATAQDYQKIDSLKQVLKTLPSLNGTDADTTRMKISIEIGDLFEKSIPDSAIWWYGCAADTLFSAENIKQFPRRASINATLLNYTGFVYLGQGNNFKAKGNYELSLKISKELADNVGVSKCLNNLGIIAMNQGNYSQAMVYYEQSLKLFEEVGDKTGISRCLNNLGIVSRAQGDYSKAIDYYEQSLKIAEEMGNKAGISKCLNNLGTVAKDQGSYSEALNYFERSLKIFEEMGNKVGISNCLNNLGSVAMNQGYYTKAIDYIERSLKIFEEMGDKAGISSCLINLGTVAYNQSDYSKAMDYFEQSLKIVEEMGDKAKISICINNLGNVAMRQGDYSKAVEYSERSLRIAQEMGNKAMVSRCILNLGIVAKNKSDYLKAMDYFERSLKIDEELGDKAGISGCLNNLGIVSGDQGDYSKAIDYYERSLKIYKEIGNKEGISACLNNLGTITNDQGIYSKAIDYFEQSLKIAEEIGNKDNISLPLNNLGTVAMYQGDYFKAMNYFERSLKIFKEIGNKEGISACLINLGLIAKAQNDYSKAMDYYEQSLKIVEEIGNKAGISKCLNNLGSVAIDQGNYLIATSYFEQSLKIFEEIGYKVGIPSCLINLGIIAKAQVDYSKAIDYYERSLKIFEELNDKAELARYYPALAKAYLKQNMVEKAMPLFLESREITLWLLQDNFTILSEKEKELYLEKTKGVFNDLHYFNVNYPEYNDSVASICYNNELILKGLLLKSTRAMLNAVYQSQDTTLKNTYFLMRQYRNQVSKLQGSEAEGRDERIAELEGLANEQERKLVRLSSQFADIQSLFTYRWEDVQKALKPGEAAVEFVSFSQGDKNDTTVYAALLITPQSERPQTIRLFEDAELRRIIGTSGETSFTLINKLYGTDKHYNAELYKLIWQPLEQFLSGISTVYYAPVGVLNKVSFAALALSEGVLLCDRYKLQQVSSTGKLIKPEHFVWNEKLSAEIFGGIDYNSDTVRVELWSYLPGTLTEKNMVEKQLKKQKIAVNSFSQKQATEETFKNLFAESRQKPDILHVATHGFFYPDPDQVKKERDEQYVKEVGDVEFRGSSGFGFWQFLYNRNPMMRSGLVFAGANKVWHEEYKPTDNDGVLTAQEVSQLDMTKTKLVVLSACETGLGEIKGSEGVYGLQRAFKMAGAKFIVMSLWQVPDKETVEFMETFYTKLLKQKDIRKSFAETQKEMRKKYDPYYWAAFVLVE
jgi:tetratricopeptide (TPR) repeat protein